MEYKSEITAIWQVVERQYGRVDQSFNLPELREVLNSLNLDIPERTLRRRLLLWVGEGRLARTGKKRGTRYQVISPEPTQVLGFLQAIDPSRRNALLSLIRDRWTHASTAIEGNTLSLGDTHAILELGLTISGKPLREHQEVLGHARAIDLLYRMVTHPVSVQNVLDLHKAVQHEILVDTLAPLGAWKVEPNYTSSVTSSGEQVIIEYAAPDNVPSLMDAFVRAINRWDLSAIDPASAPACYARLHLAFVYIHPFADGNGRMARLVSNLPLLKAGLPPLLIDQDRRRKYIALLADYQSRLDPPNSESVKDLGLWPEDKLVVPFEMFCASCYQDTLQIIYPEKGQ